MHIIVVLSTIRLEKVWKMSHIKRHIKRFGSKVTIAITSGVEKKVREIHSGAADGGRFIITEVQRRQDTGRQPPRTPAGTTQQFVHLM